MYPAVTGGRSRLTLVVLVLFLTGGVPQSQSRSLSREPERDVLLHVECSSREEPCDVSRPISFTFASELDPLQTPVVTVEPPLTGLGTQIFGNQLLVGGQPASGIRYRIRIGRGLRDTRSRPLSENDYEFTATWKLVPSLSIGNWASYVVVSPKAAQLPFVTRGISRLDAFVYAVDPTDWSRRDARPPPGRIVATETIQVTGRAEDSVRSDLDLTPAFPDGLPAHRLVIVSSGEAGLVERLWVQGTDVGVAVLPGSDDSIVWATSLRDGSSLGGVEVSDDDGTALGRTDSEGVLRVKGLAPGRLVARLRTDVAFVPPDVRSAGSNTRIPCSNPRLQWAVLDAQGFAYLPGQTVHAIGRLLRANTGACGKLGPVLPDSLAWKFESFRSEGRDAEQGSVPVTPSGAFEIERSIDPSLGATALVLKADVPGALGGHWSARIVSTLAPEKGLRAGELSGPRGVVVA